VSEFGRRVASFSSLAVACAALHACGGQGSAPATAPAPPSTSVARQTTLLNAARGTLTVVLSALETASFYGNYLRPGVGLALGALPPANVPTCHPATRSASTAFANQTGTTTLVTTAFYPASDATCSQSPFRILVMQYALGPGSTENGFGYEVAYSQFGDPVFGGAGAIVATDAIISTIYKGGDGTANIVASIAPNGAEIGGSNGPPAQPPAGVFPATFPANMPAPPAVTPFGFYFAVAEHGASSTIDTASLQGTFPAPPNFTNGSYSGYVSSSDSYALTASPPDAQGRVALSLVDKQPLFVADVSNGIVPTVTPSYPFASGATSLGIGPLSPLGYRSSHANLPTPIAGSATYDASGTLVACVENATDPLDGVRVQATCGNGGTTIALTVTDLFVKTSAIAPATIALDTFGFSESPFTFSLDGSVDSIAEFVMQ
jgi:hypothetical protein